MPVICIQIQQVEQQVIEKVIKRQFQKLPKLFRKWLVVRLCLMTASFISVAWEHAINDNISIGNEMDVPSSWPAILC